MAAKHSCARSQATRDHLSSLPCPPRLLAVLRGVVLAGLFAAGGAHAAPFAYLAQGSGSLAVLDTAQGYALVAQVPVGGSPSSVAVTPDGAFVYVANQGSDNVSVIDAATRTAVATIAVGNAPSAVVIAPDGARAYVSNFADGTVSVIDTASRSVIASMPAATPFGLALSADGATLYVGHLNGGTVSRIATATLAPAGADIVVGARPAWLALSLDGAWLAVPNVDDDTVSLVSTATHAVVATIGVGDGPASAAFAPDGAVLYVANRSGGSVSKVDIASRSVVTTVPAGAFGIDVHPDGKTVLTGTFGGYAVVDAGTHSVAAAALPGAGPLNLRIGPFAFGGFQSPVDALPTLNAMKAGAAVPVKWSLGGDFGLGVVAPGWPSSRQVACPGAAAVDVVELTVTAGHSSLGYDSASDTYTYAWKTQKAWAGTCRQFDLRLTDGVTRRALFQFR